MCVHLKASAPIRATLRLLCSFPLTELPLRQSWDRLQRCNRAEMPNDTGRLSDLSDRLPTTLPMAPGSVQGGTTTHPTDGETNAQTLEAKCLESHRELRQPTGHPSSSAGLCTQVSQEAVQHEACGEGSRGHWEYAQAIVWER